MAKLGDFVSAKVQGENVTVQGVYVKDIDDVTIAVLCEDTTHTCEKAKTKTVQDPYGNTLTFVKRVRRELGLQ